MTSLTLSSVLTSITVALLCGIIIALTYRLTYRGTSYSTSYVQSLVAFSMITAVVIMVIGNNLARAFGLVGSMSIVRFRMAIKDTQDIVFIFFALAIGMATGVGQHTLAIVATVYISFLITMLSMTHFASPRKREYLLQFNLAASGNESLPHVPLLEKFCRKFKLVNIKSLVEGTVMEYSYYVVLKKVNTSDQLVREIGEISGISEVNLFFDEEDS